MSSGGQNPAPWQAVAISLSFNLSYNLTLSRDSRRARSGSPTKRRLGRPVPQSSEWAQSADFHFMRAASPLLPPPSCLPTSSPPSSPISLSSTAPFAFQPFPFFLFFFLVCLCIFFFPNRKYLPPTPPFFFSATARKKGGWAAPRPAPLSTPFTRRPPKCSCRRQTRAIAGVWCLGTF